ncbi:hypothetical protein NQ315_008322 [Exocentrus adspersus]|uniref:Uncharacterized protein n=1 Tax=Exocentrus adspersus TaxID=1586481 RepID=A0AAV8V5Q3_9CUCU|nr:hypothetical protein NQ315_008322 [Exocentrus adspersus]
MEDGNRLVWLKDISRKASAINQTYPDRWIGRESLFHWPATSPDLTCLDFYLWGRIEDIVFCGRPTTRDDRINRIQHALGKSMKRYQGHTKTGFVEEWGE